MKLVFGRDVDKDLRLKDKDWMCKDKDLTLKDKDQGLQFKDWNSEVEEECNFRLGRCNLLSNFVLCQTA